MEFWEKIAQGYLERVDELSKELQEAGQARLAQVSLIQELTESLDEKTNEIDTLNKSLLQKSQAIFDHQANHEADIQRIGTALIEALEDNGSPELYDELADDLNDHLHLALPEREVEHVISYSGTVTVKCMPSEVDLIIKEVDGELDRALIRVPGEQSHSIDSVEVTN